VESVSYVDAGGGARRVPVDGLFIELGLVPNTGPFKDLVELDSEGRVLINTANETSRPGVFAAGDASSGFAEQVLISVGEGAKAALSCYDYLLKRRALADTRAATRGEPVAVAAGAA
jgi:alkyl hydroperoxide reductase subunit F